MLFEHNADQLISAGQPRQVDDRRICVPRTQGRQHQADRGICRQRGCLAPRRRALRRLDHVCDPMHSRDRVADLLHGAIIQSGNDACIVLAEAIAGNEDKFVRLMKRRARDRLAESTFTNSTGLPDPEQQVTARTRQARTPHHPDLSGILQDGIGENDFTWNKIRQHNRNPLLAMDIGADGLKTGFTKEAGYGLVGSAVQNDLRLIVVVNGLKSANDRADEARRLLNFGFNEFELRVLFAEGQRVGEARVFGGEDRYVPLEAQGEKPIRLMVPKNSTDRTVARVVYRGPVRVPVAQGQEIGVLKVWRGENVALEIPLQAAESVEGGSLPRRAMDGLSGIVRRLVPRRPAKAVIDNRRSDRPRHRACAVNSLPSKAARGPASRPRRDSLRSG